MKQACRLCGTKADLFYQEKQKYFRCPKCDAIFTDFQELPTDFDEKARYEMHTTEINEGYRKFVNPMIIAVSQDFSEENSGLDFGAGRSKIITKLLQENGFKIVSFDPFFENKPELLDEKYDYITSCEVVEHFYKPEKEFSQFKSMLNEKGKLYLMTSLYEDSIDFSKWYYKNDSTHVFFYTMKTLEWIKENYGFSSLEFKDRVIIFTL